MVVYRRWITLPKKLTVPSAKKEKNIFKIEFFLYFVQKLAPTDER